PAPRIWTPTLAAGPAPLPPEGEQFAPWDGPAPRIWTPTLAAGAAALPPEGEQFAPWDGPAPLMGAPTLAAGAAALPTGGEQLAILPSLPACSSPGRRSSSSAPAPRSARRSRPCSST